MSPAQASDAPVTEVNSNGSSSTTQDTINSDPVATSVVGMAKVNEPNDDSIMTEPRRQEITKLQPVVKLDRLSKEDMQKSLAKFVETRPKLAEELGLSSQRESESESEDQPRSKRRERKNYREEDEEYAPDTFTALVGPNKRRASAPSKPDPVVVKPKLRRLEKKFVPVLEKLSIEELMETNTYDRFNKTVENVLRTADELDTTELGEKCYISALLCCRKVLGFNFCHIF